MRIGVRWLAGATPHASVPESYHALIRETERDSPEARAWTLTWLEGHAVCELDDLARISLNSSGTPHVTRLREDVMDEDEDDWLSE